MAKRQKDQWCPPKVFAIPADIRALHGYGGLIIQAMHTDFFNRPVRRARAQAERAAVRASFKRKGRKGKPKPNKGREQ